MKNKKFRSIRYKLVSLLSLSALIAIVLSSIAIYAYTYHNKKIQSIRELSQLTEILAQNLTASIEFNDEQSASDILKSLKLNANINSAFIFKKRKELFSFYVKNDENFTQMKEIVANIYFFNDFQERFEYIDSNHIVTVSPISIDGEVLGVFAIVATTKEMNTTLNEQLFTQFIVALISLGVVVFLAFRLQKIFTLPIFKLKDIMEKITLDKNYTLRVRGDRDDEFQSLYDGFNTMINTINEQNHQLLSFGQKVKNLLDNAGQGFLSFDENFVIESEYSKECVKLLSKNIAGKDISEVLFQKDNEHKELFINTIKSILEQNDEITKEFLLELLPSELILNKKALKIEYKILQDNKFMLVITNISAQKKLEKKIKKEQDILKMIVEIVSSNEIFFDIKNEYEAFIDSLAVCVDKNKTPLYNFNEVYRTIHTFKGSFSQLYMQNTAKFLHKVESEISLAIKENKMSNSNLEEILFRSDFKSVLDKELLVIENILGENFLEESNNVKVSSEFLGELQEKVSSILQTDTKNAQQYKDVFELILKLSRVKVINQLQPYSSLVERVASNLKKELYPFEVIGDKDITIEEEYKPFFKSLGHIIRNSIDHGIEDPEIRVQHNKDQIGTISCSFKKIDDTLQLIISDDGAGIDKVKILQKALENNIVSEEELKEISEAEIYNLLFHDYLSTKDEVSEVSGRGVGMSVVKAELNKIGATMEVKSTKNVGTTFIFSLPYDNK